MKQSCLIKHLEWDSNFFGFKVGLLVLDTVNSITTKDVVKSIEKAKADRFRLIYINSSDEEIQNIFSENDNIFLVDKKVTFSQTLSDCRENIPSTSKVRLYSSLKPSKRLVELTLQSGVYSRFATDPNFRNNEYEKLYTEWIAKSVSGEIAKEVWVYDDENNGICGMLTLGLKNENIDIGLLAVDSAFRGKSIGKQLVGKALMRGVTWGSDKIQVITQLDNLTACRFYESCGFSKEKTDYIFHLWV